jgi:hypothetical protein
MASDLETKTENAMIGWIKATADNGQTFTADPRRYEMPKYDSEGNLINIKLPYIICRATTTQRLHTQLRVYLQNLELRLEMAGADTTEAQWNAETAALEAVLMQDDLAEKLSEYGTDYSCMAVVSRMPMGKTIDGERYVAQWRVMLWAQSLS